MLSATENNNYKFIDIKSLNYYDIMHIIQQMTEAIQVYKLEPYEFIEKYIIKHFSSNQMNFVISSDMIRYYLSELVVTEEGKQKVI